jgi:hypothetical protein
VLVIIARIANPNIAMTQQAGDQTSTADAGAPWRKALTRSVASFGTWFVTEHPKLILQQQRQSHSRHPLLTTVDIYRKTPWNHHLRGATSSAAQRGSSALIMFYGQAYISRTLYGAEVAPSWWSAGMAGFLGGGISSLVHTIFEPIKIRHQPMSWAVYQASLWPMMWRHALFDGTFFATSTLLHDSSYATQFGISALAASTVNLTHDLWKTQFIQALPQRMKWLTVVRGLNFASFQQQLIMKATDLGFNWWVTGLLYAYFFAN